jgi:uncharacterized membrane protein YhfC
MPSPPSAAYLLTGFGMMAVAIAGVLYWRRRTGAAWWTFGLGALAWVVGVALKFGWATSTNSLVRQGLEQALPGPVAAPLFWLYVGLLTGVFECGIALLFVRRSRLKAAGWDEAVAFGIGFGAVEAFLLGFLQFAGLLAVLAFWDQVPEEARGAMAQGPMGLGLASIPLPVAERLSALVAHVFSSALIVYSIRAGEWRWFWLSFAYKSALDALAACAILSRFLNSLSHSIALEAAVGAFAIVGLAGLAFLHRRFGQLNGSGAFPASFPVD